MQNVCGIAAIEQKELWKARKKKKKKQVCCHRTEGIDGRPGTKKKKQVCIKSLIA